MLPILTCLSGVFALLVISEYLAKNKYLKGEYHRKFVHITVGTFIAFWPWIISLRAISWIATVMLLVVLINRQTNALKHFSSLRRDTYGDILFAVAIVLCSLLTKIDIFFAIAVLHLSLADGLAAAVGWRYGKSWQYKVFGHTKTVIGSMTMWFVSLCILGGGLLLAHDYISFTNYAILLLALPPVLVFVENVVVMGFDNIAVPMVVLLALHLAEMH